MKDLINSLTKYTGLTADELTIAFESVQEDIKEDIEELFYEHVSINTSANPADWTVDKGNFLEALFDNYIVEPR